MAGWIAALIIAAAVVAYCLYQKQHRVGNGQNNVRRRQAAADRVTSNRPRAVQPPERTETGSMVYFANDRHAQADKEYRFNYKKINGAWRAYILRMPSLNGRDENSIPTHRLWDENHNPYICWRGTVTSLKDIQNISRVWADSIQEYIATGTRFGPE